MHNNVVMVCVYRQQDGRQQAGRCNKQILIEDYIRGGWQVGVGTGEKQHHNMKVRSEAG